MIVQKSVLGVQEMKGLLFCFMLDELFELYGLQSTRIGQYFTPGEVCDWCFTILDGNSPGNVEIHLWNILTTIKFPSLSSN